MTRVKICGLRDPSHALAAAEAGADFLGFVFVEEVRRQLNVQQARDIIKSYRSQVGPGGPKLVGLFANQELNFVNRALDFCDLNLAQLTGDEPPDYWGKVARPIIKQVRVDDRGNKEEISLSVTSRVHQVVSRGHLCLLDKYHEGTLGGAGHTFDWEIAREVARHHPFLLAGGLNPDNVCAAIKTVHPWGVDVSSGVETEGIKDVDKIMAFIKAVKLADKELPQQQRRC